MIYTITKKVSGNRRMTLKSATRRMDWGKDYEYAMDGDALSGVQKGFPANMEYMLDPGDVIIEVDSQGREIDRIII